MSETPPAILRGPARHDVAIAKGSSTALGRMGEGSQRHAEGGEPQRVDAAAAPPAHASHRDPHPAAGADHAGVSGAATPPAALAAETPTRVVPAAATTPSAGPPAPTHDRPAWLLALEARLLTLASRQQALRPHHRGLPPVAAPGETHGSDPTD